MDHLADIDPATALALLAWQAEMGADEAIGPEPVDRYALEAKAPVPPKADPPAAPFAPQPASDLDPIAEAREAAAAASDLAALQRAMANYPHCALRKGARNLLFASGRPEARVLILVDAPNRDEDREGRTLVGQGGLLFDRMFGAIDLARAHENAAQSLYIIHALPWRLQSRDPDPEDLAMLMPFLHRHIELAAPDLLVLMGNHACLAGLGRAGVSKLRGHWAEAFGRPALPMLHPDHLLGNPAAKRAAWADLLALKSRLTT